MGVRGRVLLLLMCAVTCIVIYFTYILNSSSESKPNKYDGIDEAIVRANDIPIHYKIGGPHQQESIPDSSSVASVEDHPLSSLFKGSASPYVNKLDPEFKQEQSTVKFEDNYRSSRKPFLPQEVLSPKPNRKKTVSYSTKSFHTTQMSFGFNAKDNHVDFESLPNRNSSVQENNLKPKQETVEGGFSDRVGRSEKIGISSEMSEAGAVGAVNGTSPKIQEKLMTWKQKQEARFEEERKWLEDGKQKLLEEKIRFQKEMSQMMQGFRRGSIVDVRQKYVSRPLHSVDPDHWEGLNNTFVDNRFPGIVLLEGYKKGRPFVAPEDASAAGMQGQPQTVDEMLDSQAEERFFQLISDIQVDCVVIRRMGSLSDGGWDVCTVPPYVLEPHCIVYSFGINYDFTFDDAMANSFDCVVKAFDPSMSVGDHVRSAKVHFYQLGLGAVNTVTSTGWKLNTFRDILRKLGHEKNLIDILKIDIEFYEWECLRNMIAENSLSNVKQLMFEMHTPEVAMVQRPSTKEDFASMYGLLSDLEEAGFRRYNVHMNPLGQYTSSRTGKTRSCCFELYYINIRFLK